MAGVTVGGLLPLSLLLHLFTSSVGGLDEITAMMESIVAEEEVALHSPSHFTSNKFKKRKGSSGEAGVIHHLTDIEYNMADDESSRHQSWHRSRRSRHNRRRRRQDLSLWIGDEQVELLSGYPLEIYVIREGRVLPYVRDPNFDRRLPIIPAEVSDFHFTWMGGRRKRYRYHFDRLKSKDPMTMSHPTLSVPVKGRVPKKPKIFRIELPCVANATGVVRFSVRLSIRSSFGQRPLPGTPITVTLRKRCSPLDPLAAINCPAGYLGPNCSEALCYPHCLNGGSCVAPGTCSCRAGYNGRYCEGGICTEKCQNGGKCIQKDKCLCSRGFYGNTCQYSKCVVPCVNGGHCKGVNKCRCPRGYGGQHCEVVRVRGNTEALLQTCLERCRHGVCSASTGSCQCHKGYTGKWCRRKERGRRRRVWL